MLYFLSKCPYPWFEVLGPFFPTSCSNETNTLKLEQLNQQLVFFIWGRPCWIRDGQFNNLDFFFLAAGLVDLGPESLNCSNAPNTEKQMWLYPKVAFRLGQHLLRAKSNTGNFGLFAPYPCYFLTAVWLHLGQLLVIIEETASLTRW